MATHADLQAWIAARARGRSHLLMVGRNLWINVLAHVYMDTILLVPLYLAAPE